MSVFQHPHLTRGIVQTPKGAFMISRGRVEMPDDIGESLGWLAVDREDERGPELVGAGPKTSARGAVATKS